METGTALQPNNFSSIARRLLLNREPLQVPQLPSTSYEVHRPVTHVDEINATDLFPCTLPEQPQTKRPKHTCGLCDRIRGITPEMLKAPIEKPYKSSKRGAPGRPSSFGRKAKITVRQVRQFFGLLKKQLGDGCTGTLFNSPTVMTGLACGVSRKTVTRSLTGLARLDDCKSKEPDEKNTLRMTTIKKFGQEWGDAVHHFVNTVLEEEGNVTVTDLHGRLSSAYADFPMCSTTLYGFLRALGFSYRKEEDKIYILGENKSESESESESEDEDDDENV